MFIIHNKPTKPPVWELVLAVDEDMRISILIEDVFRGDIGGRFLSVIVGRNTCVSTLDGGLKEI